jgi:hypothetical protein
VTAAPTLAEIRDWPATVSVATAAPAIGISKSFFHELITRNEEPCRVLKVGKRCRVITADLVRLLEGREE